jgi:magnesium transporter
MHTEEVPFLSPLESLNKAFMLNFPSDAARQIARMSPAEAAATLQDQPVHIVVRVFERLSHGVADAILLQLSDNQASEVLSTMESGLSTTLLSRLSEKDRERLLGRLTKSTATELRTLLEYPVDSAGNLMRTQVIAFNQELTVEEVISQIKRQNLDTLHHLFLLDDNLRLTG